MEVKQLIPEEVQDICLEYLWAGLLFKFNDTYDTNGILYWLGTNYGTLDSWTNPMQFGLVEVYASKSTIGIASYRALQLSDFHCR